MNYVQNYTANTGVSLPEDSKQIFDYFANRSAGEQQAILGHLLNSHRQKLSSDLAMYEREEKGFSELASQTRAELREMDRILNNDESKIK